MNSRMDRYKTNENDLNNTMYGRSNKNKKLYDTMNYDVFASNETVIDTSNEIDITKLKQMINSREDYKKNNLYRNILETKKDDDNDYIKDYNAQEYEEKNYDINSLLDKVKSEKQINENNLKSRKLINTQYDILRNLDVRSKNSENEKDEDKLQQLIDDIIKKDEEETNDEVIDLFEDLKSENTVITEGFKDENSNILVAYNNNEKLIDNQKKSSIDDFLDDSIIFDEKDFEDFKNIEKENKSSTLLKVIIFVLIVVVCTVVIFVLDSMYHFIPF